MTTHTPHLVFAGGSTGGHLFPGLAVAKHLLRRMPSMRITFAGAGKPLERRHTADAGFEFFTLPCRPMPRRPRDLLPFLTGNLAGYLTARRFIRRQRVDCVIGLGSYASAAMARAATRCDVPLVLLEQNAAAGKATRWLARSASVICLALPQAADKLRCGCPVRVTGNPIRRTAKRQMSATTPRRLIVLGGSGGAQSLNEYVPRALGLIRAELDGWQILHQAGESGVRTTAELYRRLGLSTTVVPFVADLPDVLAGAALAVSRAGGTTLSELAAEGVPAVLLPYPHATDNHQRLNADVFTAAGGAVTLDRRELPGQLDGRLAAVLPELLGDPARRERMSAAMRGMARPNAAADVATLIRKIVDRDRRRSAA